METIITKLPKNKKNESGQSMVELGVSIVVLLMLLAGVVDIGRLAFYYITIRDAAQEAASYASVFPNNNEQIFARAFDGISGDGVSSDRVVVSLTFQKGATTYTCASNQACANDSDTSDTNVSTQNIVSSGHDIEVTVTDSAFPITMPLLGTFIGSQTINLSSTIQDAVVSVP